MPLPQGSDIRRFKVPESVLVVIHTPSLDVLLIKRADTQVNSPDFWQSVTGSKDTLLESFRVTATREVQEETGIDCGLGSGLENALLDWNLENVYDIYPRWRARYAPGVVRNTEHLFSLQVPAGTSINLSPREHTEFQWLPMAQAALQCFSPSNSEAILLLPRFARP